MLKKNDEGEQRIISAVLLSLIVYLLWMSVYGPPPQPEAGAVQANGTEQALVSESAGQPLTVEEEVLEAGEAVEIIDNVVVDQWSQDFINESIDTVVTSEGGGIGPLVLSNFRGAIKPNSIWSHLFSKMGDEPAGEWQPYGEDPGPEQLLTEDSLFLASGSGWGFNIERYSALDDSTLASSRHIGSDGLQITKTFSFSEQDDNIVEVVVEFKNIGSSTWSGPLWVGSVDQFEGDVTRYSNVARPEMVVEEEVETLSDLEDVESGMVQFEGEVSWFGISDRYFMAAAIPQTLNWGVGTFAMSSDSRPGVFMVKENGAIQPGATETLRFNVYVGEKNLSILNEIGSNLSASVDFGIFGFFSHILLKILLFFQGLVTNWGLAIICLTLAIKTAFFPLTKKSFVSSRKMQALSPKMKEIKETHKDNPQAAGQAQMKLFREEGVNPLAGCLPMLIQMPVWFALYSVLLGAADLYQAEFLYIDDLTSIDPWGILPTLVGVFMFIQQRITPMSPNADPMQQKMFRMLPFVFVIVMYSFPSGLALYILINTIFSIAQMWAVNKAHPMPQAS
jgi:YidC/Oxa1 family membrane protein insertase